MAAAALSLIQQSAFELDQALGYNESIVSNGSQCIDGNDATILQPLRLVQSKV
jgi:hypothetical protein